MEELLFSAALSLLIIGYAVGYTHGYYTRKKKEYKRMYNFDRTRYMYNRDGDTSRCK